MSDERKILFEQFLENKNTYNLNVGYWRKKLQTALVETIQKSDQPIINKNEKGKNFYDGNPIFSFYNQKKNKAIRIIQEDPKEILTYPNMLLLDAWIDKLTLTVKKEEVIVPELVISLFLMQNTTKKCLQMVNAWFSNDLNSSNLESYISEDRLN
jgi:hypothetical protein